MNVVIMEIFPSVVLQQIANTLAVRKVVPRGPHQFEIIWNYFGYQDDDAEMDAYRLKQANMIGPAGFVSMEDGEACRLIQSIANHYKEGFAVVEMGGRGAIESSPGAHNEIAIRGMYREYCRLMGFEVG